jgi:hypothetical protein
MKTAISPIRYEDILGPTRFAAVREQRLQEVLRLKKQRRVQLGDRVSLVFENRDTLLWQIEEMLKAEGLGSAAQIEGELEAYRPLMPTEDALSATLFIEVLPGENPRRALDQLIGLDEHIVLHIGEHAIRAAFEPGRATGDRISAVQYTRYPLTPEAKRALLYPSTPLFMESDHPAYRYKVRCDESLRASLAADYGASCEST